MSFSTVSLVKSIHLANCAMKSFDLSVDQRFIVFGGVRPLHFLKKLKNKNPASVPNSGTIMNIISIEPFSFPQKGFEQKTEDKELESFIQTFEDQGSISMIQIMLVKSEKKRKQYYVIYSTHGYPGLHILSLAIEKNRILLRKIEFTGLEMNCPSSDQIDHMVNFCAYQNCVAVHCASKISMIVFKSKFGSK
jgi:hypothetical protein